MIYDQHSTEFDIKRVRRCKTKQINRKITAKTRNNNSNQYQTYATNQSLSDPNHEFNDPIFLSINLSMRLNTPLLTLKCQSDLNYTFRLGNWKKKIGTLGDRAAGNCTCTIPRESMVRVQETGAGRSLAGWSVSWGRWWGVGTEGWSDILWTRSGRCLERSSFRGRK